MKKSLESLFKKAVTARKKAYAPYSNHKIGACILMSDGSIFTGANVENASYGGTVCAERTAIWKAITEGAKIPIQGIVVVSDHTARSRLADGPPVLPHWAACLGGTSRAAAGLSWAGRRGRMWTGPPRT